MCNSVLGRLNKLATLEASLPLNQRWPPLVYLSRQYGDLCNQLQNLLYIMLYIAVTSLAFFTLFAFFSIIYTLVIMLFFWFIQLPYDRRVTSELKHLYNLTEDLNLKNSIEVIKNALRGNFGTKHGTKMLGCQWSTVVSIGIKKPATP